MKTFASPCPNCKVPTTRDGYRRHVICSCGHHWCWTCNRTYHGNSACRDTYRSRFLKRLIPYAVLLLSITILYNTGLFLDYIGIASFILDLISTLSEITSLCGWIVVSSIYSILESILPTFLTVPLKWIYVVSWRICIVEGFLMVLHYFCTTFVWTGRISTLLTTGTLVNAWWLVSTIIWILYCVIGFGIWCSFKFASLWASMIYAGLKYFFPGQLPVVVL